MLPPKCSFMTRDAVTLRNSLLSFYRSHNFNKKVKVYAGSHQRALRKGSQLVLALARAPPKTRKKEKQ
jgi:hypothetical protein